MKRPQVLLDVPLPGFLQEMLEPHCETRPWGVVRDGLSSALREIEGVYTYAHPVVDGPFLERLPALGEMAAANLRAGLGQPLPNRVE
ncbi:MAG: hypothetical protein O7J95_03800 [Planctomycetota bacterium]|nr:hypothetical protein [Planctomycetota bacterium]